MKQTPSDCPKGLGSRAKALWDGVLDEVELDSAGFIILEDACRTVDIIDRLSGALKSKNQEWVRLADDIIFAASEARALEVNLVVNPILGEIRQQRLALKQFFAQLKLGNIKPKAQESEHKSLFERLEAEFSD